MRRLFKILLLLVLMLGLGALVFEVIRSCTDELGSKVSEMHNNIMYRN